MHNLDALDLLDRWPGSHSMGDESLLGNNLLGVISSSVRPPNITFRTLELFQQIQDAGIVLAGGFDASANYVWLDYLLQAKRPFILCTSKGIGDRLPDYLQRALKSGYLLLVSPFPRTIRRTSSKRGRTRDQFVAYISSAIFMPYANPDEDLIGEVLAGRKPVFAVDDPANEPAFQLGALPYNIDEIRRLTGA